MTGSTMAAGASLVTRNVWWPCSFTTFLARERAAVSRSSCLASSIFRS